jgi:LacI family transcriptional regulator/LacI family repressor for deo operon, udp, cdd, tsx, nupC, and nupG
MWTNIPTYSEYFQGAVVQAEKLGFKLEIFNLEAKELTAGRLDKIFHARGVRGILLCPQPGLISELSFPWSDFSIVTLGCTLRNPTFHSIAPAHFRHMVQCMSEMRRHGYRRIGFCITYDHDFRVDHNYRAGYLREGAAAIGTHIPPVFFNKNLALNPRTLHDWLKQHNPDAIVAGDYRIQEFLQALRIRIPDDLGVACPCLSNDKSEISGVFEDAVYIGRVAIDKLAVLVEAGVRGIPELPQGVHIQGKWIDGGSLYRRV